MQIDIVVMLITGSTIGDHLAQTLTVDKKNYENNKAAAVSATPTDINAYQAPAHLSKNHIIRNALIVVVVFVLLIAIFVGIVFASLYGITKTEEYSVAYTYLVQSESFKNMDLGTSNVTLNGYPSSTSLFAGHPQPVVEFSFNANGISFSVICHKQDDVWYVCPECTTFK